MKNKLLDTNYKEFLDYYNTKCHLECNDKKYCPYQFYGHACLGDILPNNVNYKRTFRDLIKELLKNE